MYHFIIEEIYYLNFDHLIGCLLLHYFNCFIWPKSIWISNRRWLNLRQTTFKATRWQIEKLPLLATIFVKIVCVAVNQFARIDQTNLKEEERLMNNSTQHFKWNLITYSTNFVAEISGHNFRTMICHTFTRFHLHYHQSSSNELLLF